MCRAYCRILQNSFASQSEGAGGNTGGSDLEGDDPEGTSAPSLADLDGLQNNP